MELTGKIVQILPLQSGNAKNGNVWKKQDYVLETNAQYPKKVCVTVWGDNIDSFALQNGEQVTISIDVESREYNGKWYTDVKAWKVQKGQLAESASPNTKSAMPDVSSFSEESGDDVLPF